MADIIRKTTSTNDPLNVGFTRTYYVEDKEVYKEELDQNLDIKQHTGSLPDGTVKEFFENGKLYFAETNAEHEANIEWLQEQGLWYTY